MSSDYEKSLRLRELLLQVADYQKNNRLDFMEWEKYPKQNAMRERILGRFRSKTGAYIYVVFGANRSGKSELGGGVVAQIFSEATNARGWCATLSDLSVKVQQRKLKSMIRKTDILYGEYNEVRGWKNRVIISKKNTIINIKTYEQGASAFQGDDLDFAWFDEECPYDVFSETLVRLGDRRGVMILTFTSLSGFTRLVNRLWESSDRNVVTEILLSRENPFLSDESKKQLLESIDPDELESRWEGKPHLKQGLIYKEYAKIHKIQRFDYLQLVKDDPRRYRIHEGIDPHPRTPHHWLRFLYDCKKNTLYVVEELKAPRESMLIKDFSSLIKEKRGKSKPEYCQIDTSSMTPDVIHAHPDEYQENAHTVRREFHENGIETILVSKDNSIGLNAVKTRLKYTEQQSPRLFVFDDLAGINWEFTRYSWDSYQTSGAIERKEMVNRPQKKDDHFMDILKYECIKIKTDYDLGDDKSSYVELYPGIY